MSIAKLEDIEAHCNAKYGTNYSIDEVKESIGQYKIFATVSLTVIDHFFKTNP